MVKLLPVTNYYRTIDLFSVLCYQFSVLHWVSETASGNRAQLSSESRKKKKKSFTGLHSKWPKMPHKPERSPLPNMPHLIIQTAEFWRACGKKQRAAFQATGACTAENGVGFMLALLLQCAFSPILISWGASWSGEAAELQCNSLLAVFSSPAPLPSLPVCLPAFLCRPQIAKCRKTDCQSV